MVLGITYLAWVHWNHVSGGQKKVTKNYEYCIPSSRSRLNLKFLSQPDFNFFSQPDFISSFSANYYSHFVCLFSVNDPERHSWAARPGVHSTSPCGDQQIDARGGPLLVGHPHQLEWTADILRHAGQLWCAASVLWWLVSLVSVRAVGLAYLLFAVHRVRRAWVSRLLEGLDKCYCVGTVILLFFFF